MDGCGRGPERQCGVHERRGRYNGGRASVAHARMKTRVNIRLRPLAVREWNPAAVSSLFRHTPSVVVEEALLLVGRPPCMPIFADLGGRPALEIAAGASLDRDLSFRPPLVCARVGVWPFAALNLGRGGKYSWCISGGSVESVGSGGAWPSPLASSPGTRSNEIRFELRRPLALSSPRAAMLRRANRRKAA